MSLQTVEIALVMENDFENSATALLKQEISC